MNDIDEEIMFTGHRFTTETIIQGYRDFFKTKHNLAFPESKIDYFQEGGELRNIFEAVAQDHLRSLHLINETALAHFIYYSEGELLDQLAYPNERRGATHSNGCVIWKFEIPNLKQIKNNFKTYSVTESSSSTIINTDNPAYDNRRLPVPFYSYEGNYDELNAKYSGDSVPIQGDFAIMQEITTYRTTEGYSLFKSKETPPKYYYSEDIYNEVESIDPETGLPITTATIIHHMNDEYTGEVTQEYGGYFIAVWNKNTETWNRIEFPQGAIVNEGVILTTDPKDTDSEELEFEIILSNEIDETDDNDNLNLDCKGVKTSIIRDTFLTSCGTENTFDILLNYNIPACNWLMRLPVESVGTGTEFNIKKKTLINYESSQLGFNIDNYDYLSVYNPNDFNNALDEETDEAFKERVLNLKRKCGFGTVRWYDLTTRDMVGVEDVKIINRPKGDWTAYIIIKPNDPNIVKAVSCYYSNRCNNLMGVNIGVEGVDYKVIDKILIPFSVNSENTGTNMTDTELYNDTVDKILDYFTKLKIDQSLTVKDINNKIDTLPGVALDLDSISGFYYYSDNENIMKNATKINVTENQAIYIDPQNIYFTMEEFNPDFTLEEED